MREKFVDLQVHTTASDGKYTPTQVVKRAKKLGLSAIAVTDHDSVGGIWEALSAGEKFGIEVVPGIEFTCYQDDEEYHMLGYFIDWRDKALAKKLALFRQGRKERARKVATKLQRIGYKVTYEDIRHLAGGLILRPHLAQAVIYNPENRKRLLQEFGQMPTIGQFINSYIKPGKPAYAKKPGFTPRGAIRFIHRLGGLAVVSHPGYNIKAGEEEKLRKLVKGGLDGIEVIYPYHPQNIKKTKQVIDYFAKLGKKFSLLATGGSDYHGIEGGKGEIGLVDLPFRVPYEFLEKMKEKLKKGF